MSSRPKFNIAKLREVGWAKWDPIRLGGQDKPWAIDEYDTYLLQAAGQLWNGRSEEDVADYLVKIEAEHMGLGAAPGIHRRALDTVKSISVYVEMLRH